MISKKAFTLIELLVVIAVLGLLSSIVLVSLRGQNDRARVANLLQFDAQIRHALGVYLIAEWTFNNDDLIDTENGIVGCYPGNLCPNVEFVDAGDNAHGLNRSLKLGGDIFVSRNDLVDLDGLESFTITTWISTSDTSSIIILSAGEVLPSHLLSLNMNTTHIELTMYTEDADGFTQGDVNLLKSLPSGFSFRAEEWHHIVITFSKSRVTVYLDAQEILSGNTGGAITDVNSSGVSRFFVGGSSSGWSWTDGKIDNVRIYSEGLSSAEIQRIYAQEKLEITNK